MADNFTDNDDWKDDYLPQLQKSLIYKTLSTRCQENDPEVISTIHKAVHFACNRSKTVIMNMKEYTLHDSTHLFRVLHIMERLLGQVNIEKMYSPELMLLILCAFFHDIGMAPKESDVQEWKALWDSPKPSGDADANGSSVFREFKKFVTSRSERDRKIRDLQKNGDFSLAANEIEYFISDFVRNTHAQRAREVIGTDDILGESTSRAIEFRQTNLTVEFAELCESHNLDAIKLLDLDHNLPCAPSIFVCLPLTGVILRIADIIDFDAKRTPSVLFAHLNVKHPVSLSEWNKHRSIGSWQIEPNFLQFSAKCTHPAIEATIREFCDLIDSELSLCNNIISKLNVSLGAYGRQIDINLPLRVDRSKIGPSKDIATGKALYVYHDTKFHLSKVQVIDLLMGSKLYGSTEVALRELLQNSIDACLLRKSQQEHWREPYEPEITIKYLKEGKAYTLEVIDNGTGMDQYVIDHYYTKVGSSFYKSTDFELLKIETGMNVTPTSRFGIGILSCFMVSDSLEVETKKIYGPNDSSDPINMVVEGQESVFWIKKGSRSTVGTCSKLILRDRHPWEHLNAKNFIKAVRTVIPNPPFKVKIQALEESAVFDTFQTLSVEDLKDNTWEKNNNIKTVSIDISSEEVGLVGKAVVGILEDFDGLPTKQVEFPTKEVMIDGKKFELATKLEIDDNKINQSSTTIGFDRVGEIVPSSSVQWFAQSKTQVSLNGIEVAFDLVPRAWAAKKNQVILSLPFPLVLIIDVCGHRDLDLNTARTEILKGEKWDSFEEELSFQLCSGIKAKVDIGYWEHLLKKTLANSPNHNFNRGLLRVTGQGSSTDNCGFDLHVTDLSGTDR